VELGQIFSVKYSENDLRFSSAARKTIGLTRYPISVSVVIGHDAPHRHIERDGNMATLTLTIDARDASKIAEALNHVYRELFDKSPEAEPLRALAQQIATKAGLDRRF
jgi:hypothetical protein